MNAGPTSERIYSSLRARLLAHDFRPGQRLDPATLAETLASSSTPVRDALNRLTGERLVTARTSEGFHVPMLDQIGLADMYIWSTDIVKVALKAWPRGFVTSAVERVAPPPAQAHATATSDLLAQLTAGSTNPEHADALAAIQARLAPAYRAEPEILPDLERELQAIAAAGAIGARGTLVRLLDARRRRRVQNSAAIVRALYRGA